MSHKWVLRKGTPTDVPALHVLFKELAVAQKFDVSVMKLQEKDLLRDGFSDTKYFLLDVAEQESNGDHPNQGPEMMGYCLYFLNYSCTGGRMIYIEDIYVKDEHRRKGVGRAMMKKVAELARELSCCMLGWSCLDDNMTALAFYHSLGAKTFDQLTRMRIEREGCKDLVSKDVQLPCDVNIRVGTQEDVHTVYCLLKELTVELGGDASSINVSENDLIQDGFLEPKFFYLMIAERRFGDSLKNEIIGFSSYFFSYSTWEGPMIYIEDLYVKKTHRRRKIATGIMKKMAEFAQEHNFCRIAWNCDKNNVPALKFFKQFEVVSLPHWKKMYLDRPAIANLLT